jgi:hypothetical protein
MTVNLGRQDEDDDKSTEQQNNIKSYQSSSLTLTDEIIINHATDSTANANENMIIKLKRYTCPWGKLVVGLSLLAIILYVIIDSLTTKHIASGFQSFLTWMETHLIAGAFAFTFVYFAATVLFVPGSILTLGSGFVFGKLMGLGPGVALASAVVLVGASLGSIVR